MNVLNRVGGALLAGIFIIAVVTGLQTGTGRTAFSSVWSAARSVLAWAGDQLSRLGTVSGASANPTKSVLYAALLFILIMFLFPPARAGRGLIVTSALSIFVAVLLFSPNVGSQLRNAVSAPAVPTTIPATTPTGA